MTPFPYSVQRTTPVAEAQRLMQQHQVRHLPVTEDHRVVAVVSERDLQVAATDDPAQTTVDAFCVHDPYLVDLNTPLDEVLLGMAERHIGSAIVTRHGQLAGMFTSVDACRCFGEFLRERFPQPHGDDAA
jgi:acetoin utilization protein AcuB